MLLEVIATCVEDARLAEAGGADRIELITAITEGGLTPGIGMVQQVAKAVGIPVQVMVRPHSRSFVYSPSDIETMIAEIEAIRSTGAAGIVIGALTEKGEINESVLERLLAAAGTLDVTFHRAFDELCDQRAGWHILARYPQISRVLTSGGLKPAPEAVSEIRELVALSRGQDNGPRILAGYGLTPEVIADFVTQTGVTEVHFGSALRIGRQGLAPVDPQQVQAVSRTLRALA